MRDGLIDGEKPGAGAGSIKGSLKEAASAANDETSSTGMSVVCIETVDIANAWVSIASGTPNGATLDTGASVTVGAGSVGAAIAAGFNSTGLTRPITGLNSPPISS